MSNKTALVSIIVPCRNEAKYVHLCLDSILANDFPKNRLEVLVVDGMSEDGTRAILEGYAQRYRFIRILDNPKKITPCALNIGVEHAKYRIIMRMDAHCLYPTHYISRLLDHLEKSRADNVGGIWIIRPANESPRARAIAIALSHPLGVGNSYFRIGTSKPRWVDTVPFGCYRKYVFDRIGLFDEELIRNQDDEFNHRLRKRGGRILLVPDIVSYYYARESLSKLWLMHYQYGYFKPLAARKLGAFMTLRQLVPSLFILTLLTTALGVYWSPASKVAFGAILGAYILMVVGSSIRILTACGFRCALNLCLAFPILHFSYGLGFLKGFLDFFILNKAGKNIANPLSSR